MLKNIGLAAEYRTADLVKKHEEIYCMFEILEMELI